MPPTRSVQIKKRQIIWLVAIIAAGVIVGVTVGLWWGLGAAAVLLAISEVTERVQRSRQT